MTLLAFFTVTSLAGCAGGGLPAVDELPFTKVEPGKADTSAEAVFLDFTFDAELHTDRRWSPEQQIEDQLLYTVGQLNGVRARVPALCPRERGRIRRPQKPHLVSLEGCL